VIIATVVLAVLAGYRWLNSSPPVANIPSTTTTGRPQSPALKNQPTILRAAPDNGNATHRNADPKAWSTSGDARIDLQPLSEVIDPESLPFLPIPTLDPHPSW
jgi:hypothetical protein